MSEYRRKSNLGMNTMEQTEAQWAADSRVFDVNVVLVCTDGSNQGKHKMADGLKTWAQLSFVDTGGGGGGQLTADELAAINGSASPSAANVVITTSALTAGLATKEDRFIQFFQATIDGVLHNFKPNFIIGGKMSWVADEDATAVFFFDNSGAGFWKLDIGPSGVAVASDAGDEADPTAVPSWDLTGITLVVGPQVYGPTSQEAIEGLAQRYQVGKTLYVDATLGDDDTAIKGREDKPYETCTAAKAAAVSGDLIKVRPGTYNEKNLLKNGVNWYFETGAIVRYANDAQGFIFDDGADGTDAAVVCSIDGHGLFQWVNDYATATDHFGVLRVEKSGSIVRINGKRIEQLGNNFQFGWTILQYNGLIYSTLSDGIFSEAGSYNLGWHGGTAHLNAHRIEGGDIAWAGDSVGGDWYINAQKINLTSADIGIAAISEDTVGAIWITTEVLKASSQKLVQVGAKVYITAQKIWHTGTGAMFETGGSSLWVTAQKLTSASGVYFVNEGGDCKAIIDAQQYECLLAGAEASGYGMFYNEGADLTLRGGKVTITNAGETQVGVTHVSGSTRMIAVVMDFGGNDQKDSNPISVSAAGLVLDHCTLIAPAGADSITAGSAVDVVSYGSYANTAVDGNVTVDGLLTVGAYVA